MAQRKSHTQSFQPWSYCDRCGFWYPLSQLIAQLGKKVCTTTCYDNLDINYRPFIIVQVLGDDSQEKVPVTPELYLNPEEIYF